MITLDLPIHLRAAMDKRSAHSAHLDPPIRQHAVHRGHHAADRRVLAQAPRPEPRVQHGEATVASGLPAEGHDAVSLMRGVLDDVFAHGKHLAFTDGSFRRFARTHWAALTEVELGGLILKLLPSEARRGGRHPRAMIREVIDLLKMQQATGPDRDRLIDPSPVINVANGELWIGPDGSVEFRPHNPASNLRYCLDVTYDPSAVSPLYDHTLTEIFSASGDTAALVALWHELVGYALQPARPDARIFVGWGAGNDGKSALAGLLTRLLGRDRVAAMPVSKLASNPFMIGHLADKTLFLDDDVAVGTVLPDGLLKTISEDKVVTGEPKHRDAFEFRVRVLPLLLCNTTPHLPDHSQGFRRRLTVFPFDRRFTDAEADRTVFARIWAAEQSGVLNRALEGLQRVIQRGWKFDPPQAVTRATAAWWAEATGTPSLAPMPLRRPTVATLKPPVALQIRDTGTAQARTPKAEPSTPETSPDINVRVVLPEARKGGTVLVQVNATEVEVRVTVASAQRLLRTPVPTNSR